MFVILLFFVYKDEEVEFLFKFKKSPEGFDEFL